MSSNVSLQSLCDSILKLNKKIQSVAVINNRGRTIEKISRPQFIQQYPDHLSELFCMSCVLQVSLGRDFDENYGPINYHISERTNLTMISLSLGESVVLVTTEKSLSPISLARKIADLIYEVRE